MHSGASVGVVEWCGELWSIMWLGWRSGGGVVEEWWWCGGGVVEEWWRSGGIIAGERGGWFNLMVRSYEQ